MAKLALKISVKLANFSVNLSLKMPRNLTFFPWPFKSPEKSCCLTNKSENIFNFVTRSAWTPMSISMPENNSSSCISPRITHQSSAIHSDSLHTDNNWNNWTSWKFWFILFSIRSNVTGQHDWQHERLTGQRPNQSRHCPLTQPYRHNADLCWTTLPCLLQGALITLYSAQQFNKNIATQWNYM